MTTGLAIKSADLHYGAAQALYGISIECKPGRITAVLGRNGVGKSSTLRAVTGIGYVPQGREIFPLLTVRENLETGYAGLKGGDKNIPDYIFTLFPVLKSML